MDYETAMCHASEIANALEKSTIVMATAIDRLENKLNEIHTTQMETKIILERIHKYGLKYDKE